MNYQHDQANLNRYFSEHWQPNGTAYQWSGHARLAELLKDQRVLDVGCGHNPFQHEFKLNVWGIDPAFTEADEVCTIEEYQPRELFDVATCLGSVNFGDERVIAAQIAKIVACLKPQSRIYWRLNPGRKDHISPECQSVPFFPWDFQRLRAYAQQHGFEQVEEHVEQDERALRLYAEWVRN